MVQLIVGALLGFSGPFILWLLDRGREHRSVRIAIACEIATLAALVRNNGYVELFDSQAKLMIDHHAEIPWPVIPARDGYFSVFESAAATVGRLTPEQAVRVVALYQAARSILDTFGSQEAIGAEGLPAPQVGEMLHFMASRLRNWLILADEIVEELAGDRKRVTIAALEARLLAPQAGDR